MAQAAQQAQVSPLHLSFTGSVRVLRRALPAFQTAQPHERFFFSVGSWPSWQNNAFHPERDAVIQGWWKSRGRNSPLENPPIREAEPFDLNSISRF